ncbi:MAG: ComF family protein [Leptospiraceae bacterium]|nr:ComF family protein [Leptospiraceae bacterium]
MVFPSTCIFCGKLDFTSGKIGICKKCIPKESFFHDREGYCKICKSILKEEICEFCNSRNIFFEGLEFIRWREEKEKKILHDLKFLPVPILSGYFRIGLVKTLKFLPIKKISHLVTIPSNRKTKRGRPVPAVHSVLKKIEKKYFIKSKPYLKKISKKLQSGQSFQDRFIHARFAFEILPEYKNNLSGTCILVDDIFTTGASINECARILKENGAEKVFCIILARGKN